MFSFDISNLLTSVPLKETTGICADVLYRVQLSPSPIPEAVFIAFMVFAMESVKFSFSRTKYRQIDGITIVLWSTFFVGFHEHGKNIMSLERYLDDRFCVVFDIEEQSEVFHGLLNYFYPVL